MRFKPVPLLVLLPHLQLVNSLILHICGSWILSGYFSVWIFITPLPKNYHSSSLHIHYTILYCTVAPNYVVLMLPTPGKLKSFMLWLAHHWLIFSPCWINFLKSSTSAWSFCYFPPVHTSHTPYEATKHPCLSCTLLDTLALCS